MSTLVDAHAHFHECFSTPDFLRSAATNFKNTDPDSVGVLLLCEISSRDPLAAFQNGVQGWESKNTDEHSIVFSMQGQPKLVLVAARQIVTSEKLEILGLCTSANFESGLSLSASVEAIQSNGGVPVVPWGFGKWSFQRGQQLKSFLDSTSGRRESKPDDITLQNLLLGDSGCRITGMKHGILQIGEAQGVYVTAGSDPLPLSGHMSRPGSFGMVFDESINLNAPTDWLRDRLRSLNQSPKTFGRCRSLLEFVSDQARMRLRSK